MGQLQAIVRKDLATEFRKKGVINTVLLFSVLVLLVVYVSIEHDRATLNRFGPPAFWISVLFSSFLSLNHLMRVENEHGGLTALICSPVPAWKLYVAKCCSTFLLLIMTEAVMTPFFFLLFGYGLTVEVFPFIGVLVMGTIGISLLGTIFSSLLVLGRASEFLLPVLMLPLMFPLLIAAVQASTPLLIATTEAATVPIGTVQTYDWILFLMAIDLIFLSAGTVLSSALYKP